MLIFGLRAVIGGGNEKCDGIELVYGFELRAVNFNGSINDLGETVAADADGSIVAAGRMTGGAGVSWAMLFKTSAASTF